ncbi:hypothetical protein T03_8465 [Trichinella britovi]|uniref:EGF-like domain-containing protein n=1 Tax=Trichinella britovi TaxID=45882 RepID=A0A0V1AI10_TRIBR|nr:hypothetical protein T03_8465 [Trichinella britovi]
MEHNETCTENGGTIIKTEAGYFCECDDSRHGTLCEKNFGNLQFEMFIAHMTRI